MIYGTRSRHPRWRRCLNESYQQPIELLRSSIRPSDLRLENVKIRPNQHEIIGTSGAIMGPGQNSRQLMNSQPILRSICPRNLLSFGPDTAPIELRNLNILIGANGSGKSNLIEIIALLDNATRDLTVPIREGGGMGEWLWKDGRGSSKKKAGTSTIGSVDVMVSPAHGDIPTEYFLAIGKSGFNVDVVEERLQSQKGFGKHPSPYLYFEKKGGRAVINVNPGKRHGNCRLTISIRGNPFFRKEKIQLNIQNLPTQGSNLAGLHLSRLDIRHKRGSARSLCSWATK